MGAPRRSRTPASSRAFKARRNRPSVVLLRHHGLHVEIRIDREHLIGRDDPAGISDVVLESAITTIQDLEDSVATVTTAEKVNVYRNWLGLMRGNLQARVESGGTSFIRRLNPDRRYRVPSGEELVLPGRSLMLVRNVGHHMMSDSITRDGSPIPETFIDAAVTSLIALHDLRRLRRGCEIRAAARYTSSNRRCTDRRKPLLPMNCSPESRTLLALPEYTLKIGIMDEERRTTVNLAECIRAVRRRVVFINTGFLDRTGDEIHTSMEAAPIHSQGRSEEGRVARRLRAQQRRCRTRLRSARSCADRQRDVGDARSHGGHAEDEAGASTGRCEHGMGALSHRRNPARFALPPSGRRRRAEQVGDAKPRLARRYPHPAAGARPGWTAAEIDEELNNNAQSILGYVVRWIDFGVGCSKVPDYYNVALMEDRATLRISSQHVANWLRHGICSRSPGDGALQSMATVVDRQNAGTTRPMNR